MHNDSKAGLTPELSVTFTLDIADVKRILALPPYREQAIVLVLVACVTGTFAVGILVNFLVSGFQPDHLGEFGLFSTLTVLTIVEISRRVSVKRFAERCGAFKPKTIVLSGDEFRSCSEAGTKTYFWNGAKKVTTDDAGIYFHFTETDIEMVPRRAFVSVDNERSFLDSARECASGYPRTEGTSKCGADPRTWSPAAQVLIRFNPSIRDALMIRQYRMPRVTRSIAMFSAVLIGSAIVAERLRRIIAVLIRIGASLKIHGIAALGFVWLPAIAIVSCAVLAAKFLPYSRLIAGGLIRNAPDSFVATAVALDDRGVRCLTTFGEKQKPWSVFVGIEVDRQIVGLICDTREDSVFIPRSAFAEPSDVDYFTGLILAHIEAAQTGTEPKLKKPPSTWPPSAQNDRNYKRIPR